MYFCLVFDDEDEHIITTGAVVTLTVHLQRENMSNAFDRDLTTSLSAPMNTPDDDINDEQIDEKENRDKVRSIPIEFCTLQESRLLESRRIESNEQCCQRLE
jgi:hypothetical protein